MLNAFAFFIVIGITVLVALFEFFRIFFPKEKASQHIPYFILGLAAYIIIALIGLRIFNYHNIVYLIVIPFLLIMDELFRNNGASWNHITIFLSSILYIVVPFGIMNALYYTKNATGAYPYILIAMFVLIWTNDIFAYLTGSYLGKHKLFSKVSPKKTWEGSIGGLIFTLLFSLIIFYVTRKFNLNDWLLLAVIISITGTIGDLAESLLKRNVGIKDSGTLIPGHGGILDRFDAAIFATPFVYLYFNFV